MSCNCTTYTCLGIAPAIFQCGDDIITTLLSTETGLWLMKYEFNGKWFGEEITVTNDQAVEIPNVFNENYNHTIEFYSGDGTLINNTCYTFDVSKLITANNVTSPSSGTSGGSYFTITADDTSETITIPQSQNVWLIWPGNQAWVRNVDFTQSINQITLINGSNFTAGDTYLMMYL